MIDKLAYFIWQGEKMSWLRYMTLKSFTYHNPDWKTVLYLCSDKSDYNITWTSGEKQDNYDKDDVKNYIHRIDDMNIEVVECTWGLSDHPSQNADIFRWELLSQVNGVCLDMDIMFVKSLTPFAEWLEDSSICIDIHCTPDTYERKARWQDARLGVMASNGKSNFFHDINSYNSQIEKDNNSYQKYGRNLLRQYIHHITGEDLRTCSEEKVGEIIGKIEELYKCRAINIDHYRTIYPWDWQDDNQRFYDVNTIGDEFGIHWYAGSSISNRFNNFLTEDNFREHKNTICEYAKLTYLK